MSARSQAQANFKLPMIKPTETDCRNFTRPSENGQEDQAPSRTMCQFSRPTQQVLACVPIVLPQTLGLLHALCKRKRVMPNIGNSPWFRLNFRHVSSFTTRVRLFLDIVLRQAPQAVDILASLRRFRLFVECIMCVVSTTFKLRQFLGPRSKATTQKPLDMQLSTAAQDTQTFIDIVDMKGQKTSSPNPHHPKATVSQADVDRQEQPDAPVAMSIVIEQTPWFCEFLGSLWCSKTP